VRAFLVHSKVVDDTAITNFAIQDGRTRTSNRLTLMQSSKFVSGFTPNLMLHGSNRRVSFLAALRSVSDNLIQHQSTANQRRNAEMRRLQHAVVHLDDRIHYSAPDRGAEYRYDRVCLSVCVCVCVCLFTIISPELQTRSSPNFCACYLRQWLGPSLVT